MSTKQSTKSVKPKRTRQGRRHRQRQKAKSQKPFESELNIKRDPRIITARENIMVLGNQNAAVSIEAPLQAATLGAVASAYISKACERGFMATSQGGDPYYAFRYVYETLIQYAQGGTPTVSQIPYWLLALGHALSPKSVPFNQGKAAYKFTIVESGYTPAAEQPIGYASYGFYWVADIPNSASPVNGFPDATAPPSYTDELGVSAFQRVAQFMANYDLKSKASQLVSIATKTPYMTNVSAFALNTNTEGYGGAGVGGFAQQQMLEVPIFHPLFAAFLQTGSDLRPYQNRFYNYTSTGAVDPFFLSVAMNSLLPEEVWNTKKAPKFHAVDFNEFGDVLARWVALVLETYGNDCQTITAANQPDIFRKKNKDGVEVPMAVPSDAQCPLTLQEMLLIFRNACMSIFKDTQAGVQSLYPRAPFSSSSPDFVPFVCGPSTCPIQTLDMLLPVPVVENLRALVWRKVQGVGKNPNNWQLYVPVLGIYNGDALDPAEYTYRFPDEGEVAAFREDSGFVKRTVDKQGKTVDTPLAEVPINLIDGDYSGGWAFINDPTRLKELTAMWNTWLTSTNISQFCCTLSTIGTERGISTLCSVNMTRHWVNAVAPEVKQHNAQGTTILDTRLSKYKLNVGAYTLRQAVADTSQSVILSAPYETVLNKWILPVNYADPGSLIGNQSNFVRWQSIMTEPYSAAASVSDTGISLGAMHASYAANMVKSRNQDKLEWVAFFDEQAKLGRGGVLSGLAAGLIRGAFGDTAGSIADRVADILPL